MLCGSLPCDGFSALKLQEVGSEVIPAFKDDVLAHEISVRSSEHAKPATSRHQKFHAAATRHRRYVRGGPISLAGERRSSICRFTSPNSEIRTRADGQLRIAELQARLKDSARSRWRSGVNHVSVARPQIVAA